MEISYDKPSHAQSAAAAEFLRMEADWEAGYQLTLRAAWQADNKIPNSKEASMSKAKAGRVGSDITLKAVELVGTAGYSEEALLEKWARDSKIMDIFEGTQQIQQLVVARRLLGLRHQQRAGLVDGQPQRPAHGLGLADHDLAALVGQVDRAVGVGRAQLDAPQQVQVVHELALADAERIRRLGQAHHLPAHHVGHQREQALQSLGRGDKSRHARTPLRRRITASRRSGGSRTTASGPNQAA